MESFYHIVTRYGRIQRQFPKLYQRDEVRGLTPIAYLKAESPHLLPLPFTCICEIGKQGLSWNVPTNDVIDIAYYKTQSSENRRI